MPGVLKTKGGAAEAIGSPAFSRLGWEKEAGQSCKCLAEGPACLPARPRPASLCCTSSVPGPPQALYPCACVSTHSTTPQTLFICSSDLESPALGPFLLRPRSLSPVVCLDLSRPFLGVFAHPVCAQLSLHWIPFTPDPWGSQSSQGLHNRHL